MREKIYLKISKIVQYLDSEWKCVKKLKILIFAAIGNYEFSENYYKNSSKGTLH